MIHLKIWVKTVVPSKRPLIMRYLENNRIYFIIYVPTVLTFTKRNATLAKYMDAMRHYVSKS